MKIAFVDQSHLQYDAATPFTRPLGGTQSAVCYLAGALARRGHQVCIFNAVDEERSALGVTTRPAARADAVGLYNEFDVVIVPTVLVGRELRAGGVRTALVNWQHQSTTSSKARPAATAGEGEAWDRIVFVSENQRAAFRKTFSLDGLVLRNAPSPSFSALPPRSNYFFEGGRPPRLFYCSAPGRGLDFLLFSFPTIRASLPDATLSIYSDQKIYQIGSERDEFAVYYEVARALPGVDYFGSVPQAELASALFEADIWVYPTLFVETSCIAMMEAGCAGCSLITSDVGALPETSASFATLLKLTQTRSTWSEAFARAVVEGVKTAYADPVAARAHLERQAAHFKSASWDDRAVEWEAMLAAIRPGSPSRAGAGQSSSSSE